MVTYPPQITLRYQVGRRWRERRILDGLPAPKLHELTLNLDELPGDQRERALGVHRRVLLIGDEQIEVLGSGIKSGDWIAPDDLSDTSVGANARDAAAPIHAQIGRFPELTQPGSAAYVIGEYERWIERYLDLAPAALGAWIERWAPADGDDEESPVEFKAEIPWRRADGEKEGTWTVDGREDLESFRRIRGAFQTLTAAHHLVDAEDQTVADDVVGSNVELEHSMNLARLIPAYEDLCRRWADVALAHHWARKRRREDFELDMRRWAGERGSDRLNIGLEDGFRMVPQYLDERIAAEVPGFYAHLPKDRDGVSWQERTAPSTAALRLRRKVQERLEHSFLDKQEIPQAEIVWLKTAPAGMRSVDSDWDDEREPSEYDDAFEAIIARGWLGRYTLIAAVHSTGPRQLPGDVLARYVLAPADYDLDATPDVPTLGGEGDTVSQRLYSIARAVDDIPF